MRKLLAVAFAIPMFAACTVGEPGPSGDDGDEHMDDPPPPPPTGEGVEGTIQSDTTWSGTTRIKAAVTIPAGVTVTVPAGAILNFASGAMINVSGTFKVEGTQASKVTVQNEPGGTGWGPIALKASGAVVDLKYGVFTGGGISSQAAGTTINIIDTKMYKAGGDYIVMTGGAINMTYSQIGAGPGETDSTHCNLHINSADSITITNNNINNAPYGVMFHGGTNANFQNNNWYGANDKDVDPQAGVSGSFNGSWFEKGQPAAVNGTSITYQNLAAAKLTNAGPR